MQAATLARLQTTGHSGKDTATEIGKTSVVARGWEGGREERGSPETSGAGRLLRGTLERWPRDIAPWTEPAGVCSTRGQPHADGGL